MCRRYRLQDWTEGLGQILVEGSTERSIVEADINLVLQGTRNPFTKVAMQRRPAATGEPNGEACGEKAFYLGTYRCTRHFIPFGCCAYRAIIVEHQSRDASEPHALEPVVKCSMKSLIRSVERTMLHSLRYFALDGLIASH